MSQSWPDLPYGQTVTLLRRVPAGQDDFGDDKYSDVSDDIFPCSVQPGSSSEVVYGTEQLTSDIVVYVLAGTDVSYLDAIVHDGVKYEIQGQPFGGISPWTGSRAPIMIRANKVTGASV
jgi:hypothetical protein